MEDLTKLTDEELMAIANGNSAKAPEQIGQHEDLNSLSDEQLLAIANGSHENTDPGLINHIVDSFTGASKRTPEIESLPDWRTHMPEFSLSQGLPALKTALGTMATNPDETAKIIKYNFPDVQIRQDEKGNYIFKSGIDQQEYALKPGFRASDIPRAMMQVAAFLPAGRATTLVGSGLAAGATQAAIEASQAAIGGEFNPTEIGTAAALGTAGEAAARMFGVVVPGVKRALGGKSFISDEIAAKIPEISPEITAEKLPYIIERASSEGWDALKYQKQLAELARVNPDALEVANSMGLSVPIDTFSDNPRVREIAGASRSIVGSEASSEWKKALADTIKTVDKSFEELGATPELSSVSQKTFDSLMAARDELKAGAKQNFDYVDKTIGPGAVIQAPIKKEALTEAESQLQELNRQIAKATGKDVPEITAAQFEGPGLPNLKATLEARMQNAGSIKRLSNKEQELIGMLKNDKITYQDLMGIKQDLRNTLKGKVTDFSTLDEKIVEDLYGALAKDQLEVADHFGGKETVDRLVAANFEWAKKRELDKTLVSAFGKEYQKDIAGLMRGSITQGKSGSIANLNRLLSVVPEPLQGEAVMSAISNASRSMEKEFKGQFDFTKFHDVWTRLKGEKLIMDKLTSVMTPEQVSFLNGLSTVSKYISTGRSLNEIATGKANQILKTTRANTWIGNILGSVKQQTPGLVLGSMFSTPGYILGNVIGNALPKIFKSPADHVAAIGKLFNSPEFQKLTTEIATKAVPSETAISSFAKSSAFSKFAQIAKLPSDPNSKVRWVKQAMMSQIDMNQPQAAFVPDRVVAEVLPNGKVTTDPATKFRIVQKQGGKFRLYAPDGTVSIYTSEADAIKSATKKLRVLTNSPLR